MASSTFRRELASGTGWCRWRNEESHIALNLGQMKAKNSIEQEDMSVSFKGVYLAPHALRPLRLEEVLVLKEKDIDLIENTIHIEGAAGVHQHRRADCQRIRTLSLTEKLILGRSILLYGTRKKSVLKTRKN